jgi:alpha-beta hydrolase superfamily lysophospholipase
MFELNRKYLVRGYLFFCVLSMALVLGAHRPLAGQSQHKFEFVTVTAQDGVETQVQFLRNPGRPIVLLEPGLGAQGTSLDQPARILHQMGYFVVIGNWRGSVRMPGSAHRLGARNSLEDVVRKDFPAHLRFVAQVLATPEQLREGITVIGHSMGGMMITGALTDANLRAELSPILRAVILLQSPHHVSYVQPHLKILARVAVPLLQKLQALGVRANDMHSKLLLFSKESKRLG